MAQDDYAIANAAGATVRADINAQLAAIVSQNSGATAPSTTFAYMWWYDTTADILKQRNSANSAWIELIHFDQTNGLFRIDFDKGADIASAATTDIWAATGNSATITGTTTITSLGTGKAGSWRLIRFAAVLTLTHNGTSLILPGGLNITTAAGDMMLVLSEGTTNARVPFYQKADGTPLVGGGDGRLIGLQVFTASGTWTPTAGTNAVVVEVRGSGGGGGGGDGIGGESRGGGGGGQGGRSIERILAAALGATEAVTVGAGGTAGAAAGGTAGGPGGTVSFGGPVLIQATGGGGGGGSGGSLNPSGGAGGVGSLGDINITGQGGEAGTATPSSLKATSGAGGGEGGGRGQFRDTGTAPGIAGADGGGGGGGVSNGASGAAGGAGGKGHVIVWEYS